MLSWPVVTVRQLLPQVMATVPSAAPGPVPSLSARKTMFPVVTEDAALTDTLRPATACKLPVVMVVAALMLTSCAAVNVSWPVVVVMAAPTVTSRPAFNAKLPSVPVMAWLTFTSRSAFRVSVVGAVQVTTALTSMSPKPAPLKPVFSVLTVTLLPPKAVTRSATLMLAALTPELGANTPPVAVASVVAASEIVMSAGSSSQVPMCPSGARVSTRSPPTSSHWPEVSIQPPSPPRAPPRADTWPSARVLPSAHSTTCPPSPCSRALASMVAPALMYTAWACGTAGSRPW